MRYKVIDTLTQEILCLANTRELAERAAEWWRSRGRGCVVRTTEGVRDA